MNKDALKNAPISYQNWINSADSLYDSRSSEYLLYTDTLLDGNQTAYGLYRLINTLAADSSGDRIMTNLISGQSTLAYDIHCIPKLALHIDYYFQKDQSLDIDWSKKNDETYHRGGLADEISAIISLLLGIRLQAGGITRDFLIQH